MSDPAVIDRLARIETKLDRALVDYSDMRRDHEKRIRKVENRMAVWSGGGSALGLLIGWFTRSHIG